MHFRRLSALALGGWLAGSLLVLAFKAENARCIDQLIRTPAREAVDVLAKFQESEIRAVMLYHASEINRLVTGYWEITQFALGAVLLAGLFFSPSGSKYPAVMCVLMLVTVAFLRWFMTPQIENLAHVAIFSKAAQDSVAQDRLRSLQTGYSTAEYLKLAIGFLMAWALLKRARRSHHHTSSAPETD
jgi:hypothetical protein